MTLIEEELYESHKKIEETGRTGYEITIDPNRAHEEMMTSHNWTVDVVRLSDGAIRSQTFSWRWRARRLARSHRRIAKMFTRGPIKRTDAIEKYIIEWKE